MGHFTVQRYSLTSQNIPKEKKSFSTAIVNEWFCRWFRVWDDLIKLYRYSDNALANNDVFIRFLDRLYDDRFYVVIRSNKEDVAFLRGQQLRKTTDQPKEKLPFRPCHSLLMCYFYDATI